MHLREARDKNKMEHFIRENEKKFPRASHKHFHGTLKSMIGGKPKSKRGTSKRASRGG